MATGAAFLALEVQVGGEAEHLSSERVDVATHEVNVIAILMAGVAHGGIGRIHAGRGVGDGDGIFAGRSGRPWRPLGPIVPIAAATGQPQRHGQEHGGGGRAQQAVSSLKSLHVLSSSQDGVDTDG